MSRNPKVCPLLMLVKDSVDTSISNAERAYALMCVEGQCAWWNEDFGMCAIAALALVGTRPVVQEELRGEMRAERRDYEGVNEDG